jgi:hypothetical protein
VVRHRQQDEATSLIQARDLAELRTAVNGGRMQIIDTGKAASSYAAVLMALRLLRGMLASMTYSMVLLGLVAAAAVLVGIGAGIGWVFLDQPWEATARNFGIGVLLVSGFMILLVGMASLVVLLYVRAAKGSVVVGWLLLSLAALSIVVSGLDAAFHVARIFSVAGDERGTELFEAARDFWPMYVAVGFMYGSLGLVRIARDKNLSLLFDHNRFDGRRRVGLYRLLGFPVAPSDHRRRVSRAMVIAGLAFLCEGVGFSVYFSSGSLERPPSMSLGVAAAIVGIAWPLSALAFYGFLALAQWLWSKARQAAQSTLQETISLDKRPPILFLRSFTDDQVSLQSARVPRYLRVMDPGVATHRFEELLVTNMSRVGPVIAIGSPSDVRPPIGAAREYLGHDEWQRHVRYFMAQARAIVVSLSATQGLAWELDQIKAGGYTEKTLFIVPPELSRHFDEVMLRVSHGGVRLSAGNPSRDNYGVLSHPEGHVVACWGNTSENGTVVSSSRLSELDYEIALRHYMESSRM